MTTHTSHTHTHTQARTHTQEEQFHLATSWACLRSLSLSLSLCLHITTQAGNQAAHQAPATFQEATLAPLSFPPSRSLSFELRRLRPNQRFRIAQRGAGQIFARVARKSVRRVFFGVRRSFARVAYVNNS